MSRKARLPMKDFVRVALTQRGWLAAAVGLTAACSVIAALKPWPLKILADFALAHREGANAFLSFPLLSDPIAVIILAAVASLGIAALASAADAALAWSWTVLGQRLAQQLSVDVFARLLRFPLSIIQRYPLGDLLSRLGSDTWALSKLMNGVLITPATSLLTLGIMFGIAFRLDRELALYSFATAPVMALVTVFFSKRIRTQNRRTREAQGRYASFVQQTLSAIPLVQVSDAEERNSKRLREMAGETILLNEKGLILSRSRALITGFVSVSGTALVIFFGGKKAIAGEISVGTFLVFVNYFRATQSAVESLLKLYGSFQPLFVGLERVFELMEPGLDQESAPSRKASEPKFRKPPAITFENVCFEYDPGDPVLKDFNLHIESGESVALVGASGAGKSTILSLIPRLQNPTGGRVLFDGVDARDLDVGALRREMSFVFQESCLLNRSIRENIAYGDPTADQQRVCRAAGQAQAERFILHLPQGYETVLSERGNNISGGERQRLSTARAFLRESPILLMDEPTAAFDTATEAELLQDLKKLAGGRTVLIVAHRLSTIEWVDRIVVLENGQIIESGSHNDLLRKRGRYYCLHRLQRSGGAMEVAA